MAQIIPIPVQTFQPETPVDFGPYTVKATDSNIMISIDRTVSDGLDANPGGSLDLAVNYSTDGGTTWSVLVAANFAGGPIFYKDKSGVTHQYTTNTVDVGLDQVKGQQVKGTVTAHVDAITVSGSINVT